ncbi:hypothetical protein PSAC2689_70340 [Paraburkholderia sacchari]
MLMCFRVSAPVFGYVDISTHRGRDPAENQFIIKIHPFRTFTTGADEQARALIQSIWVNKGGAEMKPRKCLEVSEFSCSPRSSKFSGIGAENYKLRAFGGVVKYRH